MFILHPVILLIPFLSGIINFFFGRLIGQWGSAMIAFYSSLLAFLFTSAFCYLVYDLNCYALIINYTHWIDNFFLGYCPLDWSFRLDGLTLIMFFTVTLVSLVVHLYSVGYIYGDPYFSTFLSYLGFFTFFMLLLVSSNNYLLIFLGWEGVGICSYLLIGFWYTRLQASKAALKAVLINKIGDVFFLIAICLLYAVFGTLNLSELLTILNTTDVFIDSYFLQFNLLKIISAMLVLAAMSKSAQIGLHTWLPDAMEGPTPVSALIHAATMVTAGVFMLIRSNFILEHAPEILGFTSLVGALTAFFAGCAALFQYDIKRVIAYSTCSQLGYMFLACGLSAYHLAIYHLFNHAFFKAILFLCSGIIIHHYNNEQDIRKMGDLGLKFPGLFLLFLLSSLALMGLPGLSGFFSKETILTLSYFSNFYLNTFIYLLSLFSIFLTAFYSVRLLILVFFSKVPFSSFLKCNFTVFVFSYMYSAIFFLLFFVFFSSWLWGYFFSGNNLLLWWSLQGLQAEKFGLILHFLENSSMSNYEIQLPFFLTLCGTTLAFIIYYGLSFDFYSMFPGLFNYFFWLKIFFLKKWYFDSFYNYYFSAFFLRKSLKFSKIIDKVILELYGPTGINSFLSYYAIRVLNSGFPQHYAGSFISALAVLLALFLFLLY